MPLRQKEHYDIWDQNQHRSRHDQMPLRDTWADDLGFEQIQPQRQRSFLEWIDVNQRIEKVIPGADKTEHDNRCDGRSGQWENDIPENTKSAGAIQ